MFLDLNSFRNFVFRVNRFQRAEALCKIIFTVIAARIFPPAATLRQPRRTDFAWHYEHQASGTNLKTQTPNLKNFVYFCSENELLKTPECYS